MKKFATLGKIDYCHCGRKINLVELEFDDGESHRDKDSLYVGIMGNIWNIKHSDIKEGGQCLDTILEFINNGDIDKRYVAPFKIIYDFWNKYQLKYIKLVPQKEYNEMLKAFDTIFDINFNRE